MRRSSGAVLGASALLSGALLALAGCGGGDSNSGTNANANSGLTAVNLTALTADNRLVTFNSRTPGTSTVRTVSGLTPGDSLRAIDFRFTPPSTIADFNGNNALYAIGQNGTSQQLYVLFFNGTGAAATAVGSRFNLIPETPAAAAFGLDFNPTVDRIRLEEPTANRDLRLNPNTGAVVDSDTTAAGTQPDGVIAYDATDANAGADPDSVAVAYSNPDADASTGTTLYVLDAKNDTLAVQGRGTTGSADFVSPNAGRLFTVGALGIDIGNNSGFDISPTGAAFLSRGNQIYGVNLQTGAVSGGASVSGLGVNLIGIAATS